MPTRRPWSESGLIEMSCAEEAEKEVFRWWSGWREVDGGLEG